MQLTGKIDVAKDPRVPLKPALAVLLFSGAGIAAAVSPLTSMPFPMTLHGDRRAATSPFSLGAQLKLNSAARFSVNPPFRALGSESTRETLSASPAEQSMKGLGATSDFSLSARTLPQVSLDPAPSNAATRADTLEIHTSQPVMAIPDQKQNGIPTSTPQDAYLPPNRPSLNFLTAPAAGLPPLPFAPMAIDAPLTLPLPVVPAAQSEGQSYATPIVSAPSGAETTSFAPARKPETAAATLPAPVIATDTIKNIAPPPPSANAQKAAFAPPTPPASMSSASASTQLSISEILPIVSAAIQTKRRQVAATLKPGLAGPAETTAYFNPMHAPSSYRQTADGIDLDVIAQINGVPAGKLSLWLAGADTSRPDLISSDIRVRVGDIVALLQSKMTPDVYNRLSQSKNADVYITLNKLRAAGIAVQFDKHGLLVFGSN